MNIGSYINMKMTYTTY